MSNSPTSPRSQNTVEASGTAAPVSLWTRVKEHKVLQWSLAYLGAALALAHGQELLAHTYHWPNVVDRVLMGILIVGFPICIALAWYHGHRGMTRLTAGEMTVVALLLVIGAGLLVVLVRVPEGERAAQLLSAQLAAPAAGLTSVPNASVAVVPFANLTGDASKEYFSDGMAEELINELTKVPGLKVPARTSSFAYKGRNIDIRQIARDLGVATILEGSVRSAGQRIRVTAQLVNAQTGYHFWSQSYERNFGDIFKLQDDISAQIVEALKSRMNAQLPATSAQAAPTSDPDAYRLYLQARAASASASTDVALQLATQATVRDPNFARAWAEMAMTRAAGAAVGLVAANALADAEHDANQALALEPSLADAQTALALINEWRGDWNAAEMRFQRAVELAPTDVATRVYRAVILRGSTGHLREGLDEARQCYALAPASTGVISTLAAMYSLAGQDREALKYADLTVELGGAGNNLTTLSRQNAALRSGRYVEAGEIILPTLPTPLRTAEGASTIRRVFSAFGAPGDRTAAAHALTVLMGGLKLDDLGHQARTEVISWYVMLHDLDAAFDLANRSVDEYARSGSVGASWLSLWLPEMRPFRKDPRFQRFAARLKLFDYWKQYGPPDDCDLKDGRLTCR